MRKSLFFITFLFIPLISFAQDLDAKDYFYLEFSQCFQNVIPKFNSDIIISRDLQKIYKCNQESDLFVKCQISDFDKSLETQVFYVSDEGDKIKLAANKNYNIEIDTKKRIATLTKIMNFNSSIEINGCNGLYLDQNFIKKIKKIDLNKGMDFILSEVKNERTH